MKNSLSVNEASSLNEAWSVNEPGPLNEIKFLNETGSGGGSPAMEKGMTLIEILLYTAIASTVFLAITGIFSMVIQAREYDQTAAEVNAVGDRLVRMMTQEVRTASSVTTPLAGESSDSLIIEPFDPQAGTMTFSISDLTMYVTEGSTAGVPLTSGRVEVSNFVVTGMEGGEGQLITFSFTLTHINPDGRAEYEYARSFQGSAVVRSSQN